MASLLLFPSVCSYDAPLSAPKTFLNVLLSSVVNLCPYFLFIHNPFDFWSGSSETFAKSFHSGFSPNYPYRNIHLLTTQSFRVDLPRTVSGSECLNVEKLAPFVNIFEISLPFGIEFDILETIVEWRLSLYYMSAVLPIAWD